MRSTLCRTYFKCIRRGLDSTLALGLSNTFYGGNVVHVFVHFFFQPFINIARRSTQNAKRIKRFLIRLHIVIKPLIKNSVKLSKFFITLKRNSFKISSQIWRLSKVRTGWPYRWFWLIKSPRVPLWSWILNECNLSWKIVKYCILYEVCLIKTAPHSTLAPQMWCIKKIKDWCARTQIYWLEFVNLSNAENSVWFVFQEFVLHALSTVIKSHHCS